jgi:hypothetical protein
MRIFFLFVPLLLILASVSNLIAQEGPASYYAFGGAGAATSTFGRSTSLFHVGGGAEFVGDSGFGGGLELGYLGPWSNGSVGVGVFSANGLYRFRTSGGTEPFLTGGYSLGFRSSAAHFGNFGGGVIHWFNSSTGLRLEFRDNVRDPSNHWLVFRAGVMFR